MHCMLAACPSYSFNSLRSSRLQEQQCSAVCAIGGQRMPLACSVCETQKLPGAFAARYRATSVDPQQIRRCKQCSESCQGCKKIMLDDRAFATASKLCWTCYTESQAYKCSKCEIKKKTEDFDVWVLRHHKKDPKTLVCKNCQLLGYSPDPKVGLIPYQCIAGHERGHLAFETQLLRHVRSQNTNADHLVCMECQSKPKRSCDIPPCARYKSEFEFDPRMWQKKNGRLVCRVCVAHGFSDKAGGEVEYECVACKKRYGHDRFDKKLLKGKQQGRRIELKCLGCLGQAIYCSKYCQKEKWRRHKK